MTHVQKKKLDFIKYLQVIFRFVKIKLHQNRIIII